MHAAGVAALLKCCTEKRGMWRTLVHHTCTLYCRRLLNQRNLSLRLRRNLGAPVWDEAARGLSQRHHVSDLFPCLVVVKS